MRHFIIVVVLCLACPGSVDAANSGDLINGEGVYAHSREYRTALASSLEQLVRPLYQSVPNLSPDERAWLQAEQSRIDGISDQTSKNRQIVLFTESHEFHIARAKQGLGQQLEMIECIENPRVTIQAEMVCWAILSLILQDPFLFESMEILSDHGRIAVPTTSIIANTSLGLDIFRFYGRGILKFILIPYLLAERDQ